MRLINADAYMEKVRYEAKAMPQKQGETFVTLSEWIMEKTPSIEPKRGEWIQTSNDWIDGTCGARYYPIHCSICNYSTYDDSATNFCPNCGADMRGKGDETD